MKKIRITFTIEPELIDKIDRIAEKERRSRSQMIQLLLERATERTAEKEG